MLRRLGYPENIAKAFDEVPREEFVEADSIWRVYTDNAVVSYKSESIYSTSSQPSLMAEFMRDVGLKEGMRVLEIGGGTGYNAAVMGRIVGNSGKVVSVEYVEEIYERAVENMRKLGIRNVVMVKGDGYHGYEKFAPYDAIIVTVGVDEIPRSWIEQLADGGKIIAPINLLSAHFQPAMLFKKIGDMVWGRYVVSTSFIKARGMLGNLADRNLKKLEKVKCQISGEMVLESIVVPVIEIALASMTRKSGILYSVEENGWASNRSGKWTLCGKPEKFERVAQQLSEMRYKDLYRLEIGFDAERKKIEFSEIF